MMAEAELFTTILRCGTTTVISLSGTLDGVSAAMASIYLLDEADVATADLYVDMRAVQPVDPSHVVLVAMLRRRLARRPRRRSSRAR